jgi:hypothetical protein
MPNGRQKESDDNPGLRGNAIDPGWRAMARKVVAAGRALGDDFCTMRRDRLHDRYLSALEALCANPMRWLGRASVWLQHVGGSGPRNGPKFILLLLSFPCFKISHFLFKLAYSVSQFRLRRKCGKDFFLQFYGRRGADGRVVNVLQSLRDIERGLEGADTAINFRYHGLLGSQAEPSACCRNCASHRL